MSSKKQLLAQFDLNNHWFHNSLDGLSDAETNKRVEQRMNHVKYLAGHLVQGFYGVAAIAGVEVEKKWVDLFEGLSKTKAKDNFPYPDIDEIKAEWDHLYKAVRAGLEAMPDEKLDETMPGSSLAQTGFFDGTKGDFWAFMNAHQMYHIGQVGILRRGLGKDPMKLF